MASRAKMVVGVDGSPGAAAALRWAASEARRTGGSVVAVYAARPPSAREPDEAAYRSALRRRTLRWVLDALSLVGFETRVAVSVTVGEPGPVLVGAAKDARLLVLGVNGMDENERPVGHVIAYCRRHAPCRVVTLESGDIRARLARPAHRAPSLAASRAGWPARHHLTGSG